MIQFSSNSELHTLIDISDDVILFFDYWSLFERSGIRTCEA